MPTETSANAPDTAPLGLLEQVGMLRARRASPRASWSRTRCVGPRRPRPTLNAFRVIRAEEALAEAEAADRRIAEGEGAPLLGVPVAIKDDVDLAGHTTLFGCGGSRSPADARRRGGAAAARGRRDRDRQDPRPRGRPVAVHRGALVRRDPQPLEHRPHARWLQRRRRGGRRRRSRPGRARLRRSRARSASLPPGPAWSASSRSAAGSRPGPKPRPSTASPASAPSPAPSPTPRCCSTRSHGNVPSRPPQAAAAARAVRRFRRPRARGRCGSRSPSRPRSASPINRSTPSTAAAIEAFAEQLGELGHEVVPADPDYGLVGPAIVPRGMAGVEASGSSANGDDRSNARAPDQHPRPFRPPALRGLPLRASRAAEPALRRRLGRDLRALRPRPHPDHGASRRAEIGALDGRGYWATSTAASAACPFAFAWNVVGWPGISVPAGTHRGRPADRRPAPRTAKTTRRRCSHWRARSSAPVGGFEPAPVPATATRRRGRSRAAASPRWRKPARLRPVARWARSSSYSREPVAGADRVDGHPDLHPVAARRTAASRAAPRPASPAGRRSAPSSRGRRGAGSPSGRSRARGRSRRRPVVRRRRRRDRTPRPRPPRPAAPAAPPRRRGRRRRAGPARAARRRSAPPRPRRSRWRPCRAGGRG